MINDHKTTVNYINTISSHERELNYYYVILYNYLICMNFKSNVCL